MADESKTPPWWQPYASEFPDWQAWRAANGLLYARKIDAKPPLVVRGEDAVDLRDEIIRAQSRELNHHPAGQSVFGG
ncbi:MAG TPA: hypothetical protein VHY58_19555 [Streptosporangiaceae bacterium]|jgi:hypothetical protein|nr:hypothetical protein [Streptosporangiaceae bacterium]